MKETKKINSKDVKRFSLLFCKTCYTLVYSKTNPIFFRKGYVEKVISFDLMISKINNVISVPRKAVP